MLRKTNNSLINFLGEKMNENEYNQYCNGCKLIFDHYGKDEQLNKLVEECSEKYLSA